ncbi:MAG: hypothetical protein K2I67_01035, partial [Malacoplasma sp.]|nr:hypothetical protein [Malacoplasma sp.]
FAQVGKLYIATKVNSGFLTKEKQNNQYKLMFKNDSDASLKSLKKLTTQEIYKAFFPDSSIGTTSNGLTIDEKQYSTLKDLISELLVSSSGVSLPAISDSGVTVEMYYNNGNGTADFVVKYPASVNSLIFVGSFTGFVLGNDVVTQDTLSFKTQVALEADVKAAQSNSPLYGLFNKNVFDAAKWFENKSNISHLVQFQSGQYENLINSGNFSIEVTTNEIYGTVSGIIKFSGLSNTQSVSLFAFSYSGFKVN